ncbi:MAG: tRNA (adenosine(37)-N6)-threonylcarbamoyltransferase complex dimerization subunit type 1 TsaB [Planctomycetota bacterium]
MLKYSGRTPHEGAICLTGRTLAFDTSTRAISVALLEGERVVAERRHSPESAGSSRLLAPTIQELLSSQSWQLSDLDRLVIPVGPGSFSGLRMGLVTAKILAYASGLTIAGLNTLQVIAFRGFELCGDSDAIRRQLQEPIIAVLDAQRGELFAQPFALDQAGLPQALAPREIIVAAELARHFPKGRFTGSGLRVFAKRTGFPKLPAIMAEGRAALPEELAHRATSVEVWDSTASAAGQLAARLGTALTPVDCWSLLPDYGRTSAAEEKAIHRSPAND